MKNIRLVFLRVKIKSLADEARIIRAETEKAKKYGQTDLVIQLTDHRRGIVRSAARQSLLAYGYLRGREYDDIEPNHFGLNASVNWKDVARMVSKYAPGGTDWQQPEEKVKQALADLKIWTEKKSVDGVNEVVVNGIQPMSL